MEQPDNWIVLKIDGEDPHYRVLAGWSGGYATGDSWKLNSGIVKVIDDGDAYIFEGTSGSKYLCHKGSYTLRMNNAHIFDKLKDIHGDNVSIVDEDTEWIDMDWIITNGK